jgi:hypothetical protein
MINLGPSVPAQAIIVVGDADNQGVGELEIEQVLERGLDFQLISFADDADKARDFDPGLVIISSSVNANTLNDEWDNEILPVIVMNDAVFPFMDMTDDGANDHQVDNDDTVDIEEKGHPIVAEFESVNDIQVADDNIAMAIGSPEGDGVVIASVGGGDDGAIFGYEYGSELTEVNNEDARFAKHRRFGLFPAEGNVLDLNSDGEKLMRATFLYVLKGSVQQ